MDHPITLMTDSACDLPESIVREWGIRVLTLPVTTGKPGGENEDFTDDPTRFYQDLRTGLRAFTSAINRDTFLEQVSPILEKGGDALYLSLSSMLSSTYDNAQNAKSELARRYPSRTFACLDTRSAALGEGLLVYLAAKKIREGLGLDAVISHIQSLIPHLCHWFTVDNLGFLKRGGRINATIAVGSSSLHMKPVLHVDGEGRLVHVERVRGRSAAIRALFEKLLSTATDLARQTIMISHGDCEEDAQALASMIKEACAPKEIIVNTLHPVIGAHSGPGTLALFFLGTVR